MPRLSLVTLAELPGLACPYCGRTETAETPEAVSAATLWGTCGVKLMDPGPAAAGPVGLLLFAPTEDRSGALLTCAWVEPGSVRSGYGRQLVQAAAAELVHRRVPSIIAVGGRRSLRCSAPPRDFLRAVGFTRSPDERIWRLDLDRTVTERNGVRSVFERLIDSLRPATPPEPAGGAISGRTTTPGA